MRFGLNDPRYRQCPCPLQQTSLVYLHQIL